MFKARILLVLFFVLSLSLAIPSAQAQTYSLLYTFTGGADGAAPDQRLTLDSAGNIYGGTLGGGNNNGCGTIFKISNNGKFSVLYTFTGGTDSCDVDGLVRDGSGNIYGTGGGGTYGNIFQLSNKGKLTSLYSFTGGADGANPYVGMVRDAAGNLYGTTVSGGDMSCSGFGWYPGCGVVFKLGTYGNLSVLYAFTGGFDGASPLGPIVRDTAGNLYGNTIAGGDLTCSVYGSSGCGTVYKLDSNGNFTVLHTFSGGADGSVPSAVIFAGGNLYGTTGFGGDANCSQGAGAGCGVIFKIDGKGKLSALHAFTGGSDGAEAYCCGVGALARDGLGNLYGETDGGGDLACDNGYGCGTVFKLDSKNNLTVLHDFTGGVDGTPSFYGTDLVRDQAGNLYGVTYPFDNPNNLGTVFKVTPYPVSFSPASLTFPAQTVGTTSAPKTVTLYNNQSVALNIASIVASAQFSAVPGGTKPCGSVVAANSKCTFVVRFSPTKIGTIKGAVTVTDDAPTSPQIIGLTGKGK